MSKRARSVLSIDLTHEVEEGESGHAFFRRETLALYEITEALRRGAVDPSIAGLLIRLAGPEIGWAKAESLHHAILAFRHTGKPTLAVLSSGGNSAYFVASAAAQVALDPASTLDIHALASESFYLKDLLGELGVEPELDAIGEFKSSGEMFTRRESSDASRLQTDEIVGTFMSSWSRSLPRRARFPPTPSPIASAAGLSFPRRRSRGSSWTFSPPMTTPRTFSKKRSESPCACCLIADT